ncbi:DNA adenine methylase [Candidatus Harpocratesius sp.]
MELTEFVDDNKEKRTQNSVLIEKRIKNRKFKKIVGNPHPFLKWAGGKRQLIEQYDEFIPNDIEEYIEPFVGGGAMFFYLLPDFAILIDNNPVLINSYKIIKNNVNELLKLLEKHENNSEYYYKIRSLDRHPDFDKLSDIEKASRTIYLNRCCYNGLYRVNKKGQFNVPFGRYKNPIFCDKENLLAVHQSLQNVELICDSFEKVTEFATENSFIYMDPPYVPISDTASFTSYTKEDFGKEQQIKLKKVFETLDKKGSKVMLSNSYCEFILDLYEKYEIKIVYATRAINSNANKRGKIKEILILNY